MWIVDAGGKRRDDARRVAFAFRVNEFRLIESDITDVIVNVQLDPMGRYGICWQMDGEQIQRKTWI